MIRAKFAGNCPFCGIRFRVGHDMIEKKGNGKWGHVTCPMPMKYETRAAGIAPKLDDNQIDDLAAMLEDNSPPKTSFNPTPHQIAIFEFIKSGEGHAVIEAVAGSGKTTTIVEGLSLTPTDVDVAFVAFNNHIAKELKRRAPNHVHVSTLHSLGLLNIRNFIGKQPKIDNHGDKLGGFMEQKFPVIVPENDESEEAIEISNNRSKNFQKRSQMRKLVSIAKSVLVDAHDGNAVLKMIERYNIEIDDSHLDELVDYLPELLDQCKSETNFIDFDDMLWLPIVLNIDLKKFDFLMVDEAQDMNACQIQFILRSIKENGRIIAVGDRKQSLYAFRGADSKAIQNIIDALGAEVLPLSITFRCPSSHVEIAQRIVPQITARDNAPIGSIVQMEYFDLVQNLNIGDMVICRANAPLVTPAFECIRQGKKAVIRGQDIGMSLVAMIKRFGAADLASLDVSLNEYFVHEYERLLKRGKEMQAQALQDKVETIRTIMDEVSTVADLMSKIQMLFDDGTTGIIFSSVHRAKGLEANNVFILRPDLMPHPKAKSQDDMEQELNCLYVAITRSKDKLHFVKGDARGPAKGEMSPLLKGA